jgi:hypothetical protein
MIAMVSVMMKQPVKLRRGRERDDHQQVSDEQENECFLPPFRFAEAHHRRNPKRFN